MLVIALAILSAIPLLLACAGLAVWRLRRSGFTSKPATPVASPAAWWINRVLNAIALSGVISLFGLFFFVWLSSFLGTSLDPHGYGLIFSVVGGVVLLVPLFLLVRAAFALWRLQRSGFVFQAILGAMVGFLGVPLPFTEGGWIFIGAGVLLAAPALAGMLMTRRGDRRQGPRLHPVERTRGERGGDDSVRVPPQDRPDAGDGG